MKVWFLRGCERFALLGVPTIIVLLLWRRKGVERRTLYQASWANPFAYLLWLAAMILVAILFHRPRFLWISSTLVPASLAFAYPLLLSFGSLILCVLCVRAKQKEQPFIILSNLLMLILWVSSVVAPN